MRPPPRILIVEDEPDQLEMYACALEAEGFVVVPATTGTDAIARSRTIPPDLVVLDVRLPDMSGWDVCSLLKSEPRTERVPIIVLTAAAAPTLAADAADAGCAACLLKPCYPDQLVAIIRNLLATA